MKHGKRIVALIPARLGSVRVKSKSLRIIAGKPLIYYSIKALQGAESFDEMYVNSESELIGSVARRYGIDFYKRPEELATSQSMIDEYIHEVLTNVECDVLAVVNPTSPFITSEEIDEAIDYFLANDFDTMLACEDIQTHCFLQGRPMNFSTSGKHPRSQDIPPVKALNFAVTVWNARKFVEQFEERGYAVYTGKLGFFTFEGLSTIDIDWEEDFLLAEIIMENLQRFKSHEAVYDPVLDEVMTAGGKTER
jgi:CMP-N-acetylneuraminic acid synthetase